MFKLYILIIPGTILVSYFDYPMSFGLHNAIEDDVKLFTADFTFISIGVLLLLLSSVQHFFNINGRIDIKNDFEKLSVPLLIASMVVVSLKIISLDGIPLVYALQGNAQAAAVMKALILKGEDGAGGFVIGYIFKFVPYIAFIYHFINRKNSSKDKRIFYLSLTTMFVFSTYNLEKYRLAYLLMIMLILQAQMVKQIALSKVLKIFVLVFAALGASFMLLHSASADDVVVLILMRAFIGQPEGAYMIYQALEPDINRALYGLPLGGLFNTAATDPASDVVKIFFPNAGDSWVNSNTYIQAHAWSIFGNYSIVFAPLMIMLNIAVAGIIKIKLSKYFGTVSDAVYATYIFHLPIVNDFSYFLYFKTLVFFIVLFSVVFLLELFRRLLLISVGKNY